LSGIEGRIIISFRRRRSLRSNNPFPFFTHNYDASWHPCRWKTTRSISSVIFTPWRYWKRPHASEMEDAHRSPSFRIWFRFRLEARHGAQLSIDEGNPRSSSRMPKCFSRSSTVLPSEDRFSIWRSSPSSASFPYRAEDHKATPPQKLLPLYPPPIGGKIPTSSSGCSNPI